MKFLTVDRILWVFAFIIQRLQSLVEHHEVAAQKIQEDIDKLSVSKNKALTELKRAQTAADKISDLLV